MGIFHISFSWKLPPSPVMVLGNTTMKGIQYESGYGSKSYFPGPPNLEIKIEIVQKILTIAILRNLVPSSDTVL